MFQFQFMLLFFVNIVNLSMSHRLVYDNITFFVSDIEPIIDNSLSHPDFPNQCYHRDTKHVWNVGEQWGPSGTCWIARCLRPGKAIIMHCGSVSTEDTRNCAILGMDIKQPYPSCCVRFYCKSSSRNDKAFTYNPLLPGGGKANPYTHLVF